MKFRELYKLVIESGIITAEETIEKADSFLEYQSGIWRKVFDTALASARWRAAKCNTFHPDIFEETR